MTKRKRGAPPGNTNAAKRSTTIYRPVRLPTELDAKLSAFMTAWNLNRSEAIIKLLTQSMEETES